MKKILFVLGLTLGFVALGHHSRAEAACGSIPNVFTNAVSTVDAATTNANNTFLRNCATQVDNTQIGGAGIFGSQVVCDTVAHCTFGTSASVGYSFLAAAATVVPLTITAFAGQSVDILDVNLAGGSGGNGFKLDFSGNATFTGKVNTTTINASSLTANQCVQTDGSKNLSSTGSACAGSSQTAHGEIGFAAVNCAASTNASPVTTATIASQTLPVSPTGNWRLTITVAMASTNTTGTFGIGTVTPGATTYKTAANATTGGLRITGGNAVADSTRGGSNDTTYYATYSASYASSATAGPFLSLCGTDVGTVSGMMYWTAVPA